MFYFNGNMHGKVANYIKTWIVCGIGAALYWISGRSRLLYIFRRIATIGHGWDMPHASCRMERARNRRLLPTGCSMMAAGKQRMRALWRL